MFSSRQYARVQGARVFRGPLERSEGVISQCNLGLTSSTQDTHLKTDAMSEVAAAARWLCIAQRLASSGPCGKASLCHVECVGQPWLASAFGRLSIGTARDSWVGSSWHGQSSISSAHSAQAIDAEVLTTSIIVITKVLWLLWSRRCATAIQSRLASIWLEVARSTPHKGAALHGRVLTGVAVICVAAEEASARRANPHGVLTWIAAKVDARLRASLVPEAAGLVETDIALTSLHTMLSPVLPTDTRAGHQQIAEQRSHVLRTTISASQPRPAAYQYCTSCGTQPARAGPGS